MKKAVRAGVLSILCICLIVLMLPVQAQAKTGWQKEDGKWYYYDEEGYKSFTEGGVQWINENAYAFDQNGAMVTGWYEEKCEYEGEKWSNWYYADSANDSKLVLKNWKKIGSIWYWFDEDCVMMSGGSAKVGGKLYVFKNSGALVSTAGWVNTNEGWFYTDKNGIAYTGWKQIGGKWYYFSKDWGVMCTGACAIDGKLYTFSASGAWTGTVTSAGWKKNNGSWYYVDGSGKAATGWKKISGKWYYFEKSTGIMLSNCCEEIDGIYYFFTSGGALVSKSGWQSITYGDYKWWYYVGSNGVCAADTWKKIGGDWYYFDEWADMCTDEFIEIKGKVYSFKSNGAMRTGWTKIWGDWFFFKSNGCMATKEWAKDSKGWMWLDEYGYSVSDCWISSKGEWYYLDNTGYMATNAWAEDSAARYWMGADGKITKNKWIQYDGEWYYLKSNGHMASEEWTKDSKGWMWMDVDGTPVKDQVIEDGSFKYYLKSNGYMAVNEEVIIDGEKFYAGADGRLGRG